MQVGNGGQSVLLPARVGPVAADEDGGGFVLESLLPAQHLGNTVTVQPGFINPAKASSLPTSEDTKRDLIGQGNRHWTYFKDMMFANVSSKCKCIWPPFDQGGSYCQQTSNTAFTLVLNEFHPCFLLRRG